MFAVSVPEGVDAEDFASCIYLWLTRFESNFPRGPNTVMIGSILADGERKIGVKNLELLSERTQRYVRRRMSEHSSTSCGICGLAFGALHCGLPVIQSSCCDHCCASYVMSVRLARAYMTTMRCVCSES